MADYGYQYTADERVLMSALFDSTKEERPELFKAIAESVAKTQAERSQYKSFIQGQVRRAEARAAQLGFLRLNVAPTDIQDLERYLQELLGYIAFNEMVEEYHSH
jgi:hypothetical protein